MASVRLRNLQKFFGEVKAVNDVSMEIRNEELVVFLGPSGCGKTTTLRCIAGLEKPTAGEVYFDQQDVTSFSPADRNVAMVFQFYALYPHLTAYENIAFPLKAQRVPRAKIREKVGQVTKLLKLGNSIVRRKANRLSGGDMQRVALARAIVREPRVLLLDEPLSALDEKFREEMRSELGALQKKIKVTTVYVTHDQREAMCLADRIVVMKDGEIIQTGSPRELYEHPRNLFVGYFIGSPGMNFIDCLFDRNKLFLGQDKRELLISEGLAIGLREYQGTELILGIRPENISFLLSGEEKGVGRIKVKVINVEKIGHFKIFNFYLGDRLFKGRASAKENIPEAGECLVEFNQNRICLFDKSSQESVPY